MWLFLQNNFLIFSLQKFKPPQDKNLRIGKFLESVVELSTFQNLLDCTIRISLCNSYKTNLNFIVQQLNKMSALYPLPASLFPSLYFLSLFAFMCPASPSSLAPPCALTHPLVLHPSEKRNKPLYQCFGFSYSFWS